FHRGTSPRQALAKDIGAQELLGCSRRIGSARKIASFGPSPVGGARGVLVRFTPRCPPPPYLPWPRGRRSGTSLRCASLHHGPGLWPTAYKDVDEVRPPHAGSPRTSSSRPQQVCRRARSRQDEPCGGATRHP